MSKKQHVLANLRALESRLSEIAKTGSREALVDASQVLEDTRDVCRRGLPSNSYVAYGEIYDGLILAIRQMTENEGAALDQESFSLCRELLGHLVRETEEETNFKKDIVFLPYKACMWDSLESVWKAAYDDKEHCDAYVIPIPYCDRNPDGSAAEWHCERSQFPKYVPTTNWKNIDLKAWHPDIIVIHNPYDDYNTVTSVDSAYYSSNLKNYTDKLVYIPYFVLEEIDPENEKALEEMAHFIFHGRGVLNADLTIVQSENMREAYLRLLTKYTNQDRAYWEKRILGLGSPKIDKIISTKREDIKLPEEWERVIRKADGTRKKVIFYNVGLTAFLEYKSKLLDKMEWVFNQFRERQDGVAMLWRPHPLFEATIQSSAPELWKRYQRVVKRYRREAWGIYDDSEDLHRAIAVSDGYYGDRSSLVSLFKWSRKECLLENINFMCAHHFRRQISVRSFFRRGDDVYFLPSEAGVLCKYDTRQGKLRILCDDGWGLCAKPPPFLRYGELMEIDGRLLAIPWLRKDIFCFDLSQELRQNDIQLPCHVTGGFGAVRYEKNVYFFADLSGTSFRLDLRDNSTEPLSCFQEVEFSVCSHICAVGRYAYIPLNNIGKILRFDMKLEVSKIYEIPNCDMVIGTVTYDGNKFWLTGDKPYIFSWEIFDGETKTAKYNLPESYVRNQCDVSDFLFLQGLFFNEHIYYAPLKANGIIRLDVVNGAVEMLIQAPKGTECYGVYIWDNTHLYVSFFMNNWRDHVRSIVFDEKGNILHKNPFCLDRDSWYGTDMTCNCNKETAVYCIEDMIRWIKTDDIEVQFLDCMTVGRKVYDFLESI